MSDAAKPYEVLLTPAAEQDLEAIYDYVASVDRQSNADALLEQMHETLAGLARYSERGSFPKELLALGIKEFRQTMFKPYRVIYRVQQDRVIIYLIVDGRRDMQSVLARRLLRA